MNRRSAFLQVAEFIDRVTPHATGLRSATVEVFRAIIDLTLAGHAPDKAALEIAEAALDALKTLGSECVPHP